MRFFIVIPVLNGEKFIGRCIDHIRNMVVGDVEVEIVVIDNGSNDSTLSILDSKKVKYIIRGNANVSELRNVGASLATGDFIGFVDSDCLVDKRWMAEAIDILVNNNTIGVVGQFYGIGDNPSWVELAWNARRTSIDGNVDFLPAGNMVVRKELFDNLGGFSVNLITGEDYEFCQRVRISGFSVYNSPRVNVKHLGNAKRLRDIIRKERWYALGMLSTLKNDIFSKPLLICLAFIILISGLIISAFLDSSYSLLILLLLLILLVIVSVNFTKNIKQDRLVLIIKFIPISLCYLIGRTIGLFNLFFIKLRSLKK